jgi:hypothetical protein
MHRQGPFAAAIVTTLAAAVGLAGCADRAVAVPHGTDRDRVAPLTTAAPPDPAAPLGASDPWDATSRPDEAPTTSSTPPGADPTAGDGAGTVTADDQRWARSVAVDLLDRYGQVLTVLAADPAVDLARFAASWADVADPGSPFSRDMLRSLVARVRDDRMVILPGPDGRSYRHRPVRITAVDDDAIGFTWCGYSPGIGVHVETGAVLDDAVGHASGTGRLVRSGDRWLLDALDQEQLVALPPGTADPCVSGEGS